MNKLFQRIFWQNNTTPAINATNLNAMSKGLSDVDDRVLELADEVLVVVPQIQAYLEQAGDLVETMENLSKHPPYIGQNGNWYVWDTDTDDFVDSGIDASITVSIADITMLAYGATPYVTNSGTSTDPIFHLFIPRASTIAQIAKTGTSGITDTYTVMMQDGTTFTFSVVNGRGISNVAKTSSSGLVDTYTITYNDGTTSTFELTNGAKGDTGATPNITMSASVLPITGNPDVNVTKTGTAENPNFALQFSGLKGDKGDQGEKGDPGGLLSFNQRIGSVMPITGDYTDNMVLLSSTMHIGGGTQTNVKQAIEALMSGGGHTIVNSSGTELTQRRKLKFGNRFKVTDDSTNGLTIVESADVFTSPTTVAAGLASVTISNAAIHTTSIIRVTGEYDQTSTAYKNKPVSFSTIDTVEGSVTITFPAALPVSASFILQITNL